MKKIVLLIVMFGLITTTIFAQFQFSQSPLRWAPNDEILQRLPGGGRYPGIIENQSTCFINGTRYTYWLYSGVNENFFIYGLTVIVSWLYGCLGYRTTGNSDDWYPNHDLAASVKQMMANYGAWMSVTVYPARGRNYSAVCVVNIMDNRGYYSTTCYYVQR